MDPDTQSTTDLSNEDLTGAVSFDTQLISEDSQDVKTTREKRNRYQASDSSRDTQSSGSEQTQKEGALSLMSEPRLSLVPKSINLERTPRHIWKPDLPLMTAREAQRPPGFISSPDDDIEKDTDRGHWKSGTEFWLSMIGYAVGLGNIWRFPYLLYAHGGGVFLIPYTLALFCCGLPMLYLELLLGQYTANGTTYTFRNILPLLQGIGWAMTLTCFALAVYYNAIMAWAFFYLFASFHSPLPWASCNHTYNTAMCYSLHDNKICTERLGVDGAYFQYPSCRFPNESRNSNVTHSSAASEYFDFRMYSYHKIHGFNLGKVKWELALCLLLSWFLVGVSISKGVLLQGKIVYVTAIFPYFVLIALVITGATLDNAGEGVKYYLQPDLSKLGDVQVWKAASTQVFFSLGPCIGTLITMASYNRFHYNCFRTAVCVSLLNALTSFFAGFAVFTTLGFMAKELNTTVPQVVTSDTSLVFVTYPEAIVQLPAPSFWSISFFLMIISLAMDTEFALVDTVITAVCDQFSWLHKYRCIVVTVVSFVLYLFGLPLCLQGGDRVLTLLDSYVLPIAVLYIGFLEIIAVMYVYGLGQLIVDIELMLGLPTKTIWKVIGSSGWYWRIMWLFMCPIYLFFLFIMTLVFYKAPQDRGYKYPFDAQVVGFILASLPMAIILLFAIYRLIDNRRKKRPLLELIQPTEYWYPAEKPKSSGLGG